MIEMSSFCLKKPSLHAGFHGILVDIDRQSNISEFEKGRHPRIQLNELFMTRVVHLNFEMIQDTRTGPISQIIVDDGHTCELLGKSWNSAQPEISSRCNCIAGVLQLLHLPVILTSSRLRRMKSFILIYPNYCTFQFF